MSISTQIPDSWNLPLFWATVDGSMAGNVSNAQRALLVGQMFTSGANSGNATMNVAVAVGSAAQAGALFGVGSMLYRMVDRFFKSNTSQQLWCLPIPDPVGTAATGTIIVTSGSNSGLISLYIAGQLVTCLVNQTDSSSQIATNLAAAINAVTTLPVTATATGAMVTMTCQWPGATGNDVVIIPNYRGVQNGEVYPTGLQLQFSQLNIAAAGNSTTSVQTISFASGSTANVVPGMVAYDATVSATTILGTVQSVTNTSVTMTSNLQHSVSTNDNIVFYSSAWGQLTGGVGNPSFSTAIANIQLMQFLYVGMPYTDAASQSSWGAEYGFAAGGRWNYQRQQYGFVCNARRDTYSNLMVWGLAQNQPVISTMEMEPKFPSPPWEVTACYTADAALGFSDDPARPLQTLELLGILPPLQQDRFTQTQRNNLVNTGFAVQGVNAAGNSQILVEQTQYQFNQYGQSDTAFGKLTVLATLQTLLESMKSAITSKYPRHKLLPDGSRIGPGQAAVTPTDIKAELIAEYRLQEFNGLVSDAREFAANLLVQIDSNSPNKVSVLWAPRLAGQLRQFKVLAQFRLMYASDSQVAA
jgi:phage tail sheath gpL-like